MVRLTDDALFQCPFTFMEDAGTARFTDVEVERLSDYLLKGGFLLVSDYHGRWAREQFDQEIGRTCRPDSPGCRSHAARSPDVADDVSGDGLPQMASISTWRRSGGGTIERWNLDGAAPDARGIADANGRVMVVMVHNTDMPDPWEREGEDDDDFFRFSPEAYAVGIDILLYAMTH